MKKVVVLSLTALSVLGLFLLTENARALFGMSADALAGEEQVAARSEKKRLVNFGTHWDAPAPSAQAAPAAPPPARNEPEKDAMGGGLGLVGTGRGGGGKGEALALGQAHAGKPKALVAQKQAKNDDEVGGEGGGAPTRAWFPETFLFEPLVVTDAQGRANVPVKVPDRLTTWRVLALAHSRQGAQAGAVTSFLGTLPTYIEPVTPAFLYAGDEVRLPVQVVNTTEQAVKSPLALSVTGATLAAAGGTVEVPAFGNVVQYAKLTTKTPGAVTLRATLGGTDAVEKSIPVQPAGLRSVIAKGGTLAAPREFSLTGPADTLPGTEALRLKVFPGALGLVRSELAAAPGRGGVAEDGYLLLLLGRAPTLLRSLGAEPDEAVIRELTLLATQRVMRHARTPSVDTATLLTQAALSHPDSPVLSRLGERLAGFVAQAQRPDGTCQGADGWTLQRLLVTTADCVRAVRAAQGTPAGQQRATRVSVKATGAFERNLKRINDGYTAAAVLASGAVKGPVAEQLKKLVLEHLKTTDDGAKYLEVEAGVQRADGAKPSTVEATALAVLALGDDPAVADLGTSLMAGYAAAWGWGDGRANLAALEASTALFKDKVPEGVKVTLTRDGAVLAQGVLDAQALKDVLSIDAEAAGSAGAHTWKLTAEPAVPGLGFSLQLVAFTPWKAPTGAGLSLTTALPATLSAGQVADLTLTAGVPGNMPMKLTLPLPAGVQHDTPSLDALVSAGKVVRYETQDGQITLHLPPQPPGVTYTAALKVVPTLAGSLQSGPPSLAPEAEPWLSRSFAPSTWKVN